MSIMEKASPTIFDVSLPAIGEVSLWKTADYVDERRLWISEFQSIDIVRLCSLQEIVIKRGRTRHAEPDSDDDSEVFCLTCVEWSV